MSYITRDLEPVIERLSAEYACILVTGPRQVGKTTMLRHLDPQRHHVTLDDLESRALARRDPEFFLQAHPAPVTIDEVQYAPELFSYIKIAVDAGADPGSFWLTGSQSFSMMRLARESLAGRTAIIHMPALSQHELHGSGADSPLPFELHALQARQQSREPADLAKLYERIWRGSMPGHASGKFTDRDVFYGSYIDAYIDRDIADEARGIDKLRFRDFVRAAASRVGQLLNVHSMAADVGVADNTAKSWLAMLERSEIAYLLRPYSNNLLKRAVKTPKLYFFDTGLVAYLTHYSSAELLQNGALAGQIFENYVVNETRKGYQNAARECPLWFYRDADAREIDLVVEADGQLHPIEVKRSANPPQGIASAFRALQSADMPRGAGAVVCMKPQVDAIDRSTFIVPAWVL